MHGSLRRLARVCAAHPLRVITAWALIIAASVGCFLSFRGPLSPSFTIPGTETARVTEKLEATMPEATGAVATVVLHSDQPFTPTQRAQVAALMKRVAAIDGVRATNDPFVVQAQMDAQRAKVAQSEAAVSAAQAQMTSQLGTAPVGPTPPKPGATNQTDTGAGPEAAASRTALAAKAKQLSTASALLSAAASVRFVSTDGMTALSTVQFTQDILTLDETTKLAVSEALRSANIPGVSVDFSSTIAAAEPGLVGPGEIAGLLLAMLVLVVMMRAIFPSLIPVISSLTGLALGLTAALATSSVVTMSSVTPALGVMLGLAVGIDYSLFIVNYHRRKLADGASTTDALVEAVGNAGSSVVFAGATVMIALIALFACGIPFLGLMGAVGAGCVLTAVLAAVTLTPALLRLLGARAVSPRARRGIVTSSEREVHPMSVRRAVTTTILGAVLLLLIASPATTMRLGLPDDGSAAVNSTQYRAYALTEQAFGPGANGPLVVLAERPTPFNPQEELDAKLEVVTRLRSVTDVAAVVPIGVAKDRRSMVFQVVLREGPAARSTEDLVHALRTLPATPSGTTLNVAGQATGNIDISGKLAKAVPAYLAIVIGLSLVIMVVVFRSLLVPLIATLGYVLSLLAAYGAMTAIYQWGWFSALTGVTRPGPILNFAPTIIMGVLFGLAMDYQLFVMSSTREALGDGAEPRRAVVLGLRHTRPVVVSAALIMMAVFGGFVFSDATMVRPLGLGLAVGVLLDAFVVRLGVVPAVISLLGTRAWWLPGWLDRLLPGQTAAASGSVPAAAVGAVEPIEEELQ